MGLAFLKDIILSVSLKKEAESLCTLLDGSKFNQTAYFLGQPKRRTDLLLETTVAITDPSHMFEPFPYLLGQILVGDFSYRCPIEFFPVRVGPTSYAYQPQIQRAPANGFGAGRCTLNPPS